MLFKRFTRQSRKPNLESKKSAAFLVYTEWGLQRSIPREQRLSQDSLEIPTDTLAAWMEDFSRIDHEIWQIAEQGGPKTLSYADFKKRVRKAFSFMNEGALRHAWTLCGYYTWHEGY